MIEALLVAAQSTPRERLRRMLVRFTDHIRQGAPFERAIAMLGDDMPSMLGNMLTIGNRTGRVTELLDRYIRHCQWRIELRSEVIRVVTYPYFCALTGVGIMMARDVIIMSIGGANTGAALLVVARLYLLPIIFGIIAAIVTGKALAHHALRPAVHRVAAHLPFVGGHVRKYALATFFDAFAVALDSGIIAPAAYQLAIRATANQWVGEQLARWERFLRDGEPVAETLRKTGILEKEALHLIAVGEIGASAPSMMRRLAGWYFENIRTTVKLTIRFSSPFYVLAIATGFFLSPTILAGLVFALTLLLVLT
jgi:type IV pilus assembly protein PilC